MNACGGSPAVLLCNSCNTIISDTLELRGEAVELSAYVLNGIDNATLDEVQQQAHLPSGRTRTYKSIVCGECGTAVGRCYTQLEEGLEHLQLAFLLDASAVHRWQLGKCKQRAQAATEHVPASTLQQYDSRIEQLEDAMLKVQHLMCFHSQRLDNLDARSLGGTGSVPNSAPAY